jgi:dolichyl-phosphate-mannose--protein O-mannosyl transferase
VSFFRWVGIILCGIVFLGAGYEFFSLWTPLPTLSRMTQGLRDDGHKFAVFAISLFCGFVLVALAQWLYYHFNYQARSGN